MLNGSMAIHHSGRLAISSMHDCVGRSVKVRSMVWARVSLVTWPSITRVIELPIYIGSMHSRASIN